MEENEKRRDAESEKSEKENGGMREDRQQDEIERLESALRNEKEERRRLIEQMQVELDKEVAETEQKWMEKTRKAVEEKEEMRRKVEDVEEQMDTLGRQLHRNEVVKCELEEAHDRLRSQFETLRRDYEETMHERSTVLEENSRLTEEKDRLQTEIERHTENDGGEVDRMRKKLEQTRRLLQVNMEETVNATTKKDEAVDKVNKLAEECRRLEEQRDEALRQLRHVSKNSHAIVDIWNTHSIQISLPFPKPNLGIVLGGGKSDEPHAVHGPIYVKHVLHGSPFDQMLRKMDHIVMVNDINVTDMDERSVMGMLANCHHLHLVVRRRSSCNRIHDVCLPLNYPDVGLELANGVFINSVDLSGAAGRAGLVPGQRVVTVMHTPVFDAKHAEHLIKHAREPLVIGVLESTRKEETQTKDKNKPTIFSRWFGKNGVEKERNVVAKANIDRTGGDNSFLRQGSLRMPQSQISPLVRYGSLRAPQSVDHSKIVENVESSVKRNHQNRSSVHSEVSGRSWAPPVAEEDDVAPVVFSRASTVFSSPSSPASRVLRGDQRSSLLSSPRRHNTAASTPWARALSPAELRPHSLPYSPFLEHRPYYPHRSAVYSPSLPLAQPPPYPNKEDSLSSFLSSSNSLRNPSTSFSHFYTNNSISSAENARRICLSKGDSDFSISLENSNSGGVIIQSVQGKTNGFVKRGDRLLDVGGINMRCADKDSAAKVFNHFRASQDEVTLLVSGGISPKWVQVNRGAVKLCGGNAIGILAEDSFGEVVEGDLILEIDDYNVRRATLEDATDALRERTNENVQLLIQDGGDRLNRLRLGADGDSFFVRVNVDRAIENKDELELKAGEVVFVDKTMFMGQRGRWRAWKVDREGRQRENGVIPSADSLQNSMRTGKRNRNSFPFTRSVYERVEKVNSSVRRPIVLFGALVTPFLQALIDESNKYAQCVPECRALSDVEVERLLSSGEVIDAKKRDRLFDVLATSSIRNIIDNGLHGVMQASPAAVQRMQNVRIFPIVVKFRFKSSKQIKEMKEELFGEKISTKQAKELLDKAQLIENELESTGIVVSVSNQHNARLLLKHAVAQAKQAIDDEQKKTVWVTSD